MADTTEAGPEIGHNNPPSAIESALEITALADAWVAASPEILDADMAKEAGDYVDKLRKCKAALAAALKVDLAPHDEAIAGVKALYKAPSDQVQSLGTQILAMSSAWLKKEQARIAREKADREAEARRLREEAERLKHEADEATAKLAADAEEAELAARRAAEASEAAKTAKAAERVAEKKPEVAAIKSDPARRAMTLRTYWSAVVVDETAAIDSYKDHPTVRKAALDAALRVANEAARAAKDETAAPLGFRFVKDERAL